MLLARQMLLVSESLQKNWIDDQILEVVLADSDSDSDSALQSWYG